MSRTVAMPVRINPRGGVTTEETNVDTLIALGVLPTGEGSAWDRRDNLTVPSYVWEADGPQVEAAVRDHVAREFAELEAQGRARLLSVERIGSNKEGEAQFLIRRLNLETGQVDNLVLPSDTGGSR